MLGRNIAYVGPVGHVIIGLFLLLLPLFASADEFGRWFSLCGGPVFLVLGVWGISAAYRDKNRITAEDVEAYTRHISSLPIEQRKRIVFIAIPVLALLIFLLEVMIVYDLTMAESAGHGSTWAPIALVYNLFGFWPAVSILPMLWIAVTTFAFVKLRKTRRKLKLEAHVRDGQ
jgi:hypothetical protein